MFKLEKFDPGGRSWNFSIFGPLGLVTHFESVSQPFLSQWFRHPESAILSWWNWASLGQWIGALWVNLGSFESVKFPGEKQAHKHKLFALANVQMALGQTAGCPRVNRAKKFMCSPRNTGNINFSLWLTGGLSQGYPDFQKVYVFKVYMPFSCPKLPPLLLKKVLQYTSHSYCNTSPICIAVLLVHLGSKERIVSTPPICIAQYASHLYCNTPPICIAVLLGKPLVVVVTGMFPNRYTHSAIGCLARAPLRSDFAASFPCFVRRPRSTYKKVVQGKCPLHFFILIGPFARTLFSRTLLPWPFLCYSGQILHAKVLEHLVWCPAEGETLQK